MNDSKTNDHHMLKPILQSGIKVTSQNNTFIDASHWNGKHFIWMVSAVLHGFDVISPLEKVHRMYKVDFEIKIPMLD